MSTKMSQGAVVDPGQSQEVVGEALPAWPKLSGADTGGAAFVFIGTLGPGSLVPPHTHSREDEITYILEGTMSVELGEELVQAAAGAVVWKPRGQRHAIWNATDEVVRYFEVVAPAGLEGFFAGVARLEAAGELRAEDAMALARTHGLEFDMRHGAELAARFNLRLPA